MNVKVLNNKLCWSWTLALNLRHSPQMCVLLFFFFFRNIFLCSVNTTALSIHTTRQKIILKPCYEQVGKTGVDYESWNLLWNAWRTSLTMKYGLQQRATEPERLDRDRWEKKWRGTIRKQQHGRVICLDTHGYVRMEHRTMLSVIKPNIWDRTELPASRMELNLCQKQISA